jgi:hypothetical protein
LLLPVFWWIRTSLRWCLKTLCTMQGTWRKGWSFEMWGTTRSSCNSDAWATGQKLWKKVPGCLGIGDSWSRGMMVFPSHHDFFWIGFQSRFKSLTSLKHI